MTRKIASEFPHQYNVTAQSRRVDLALLNLAGEIECAIEAKFYFRYECRKNRLGHRYFCNTWKDFIKRYDYPHKQAIIFVGNHLHLPDLDQKFYQYRAVKRSLKRGCLDLARFEEGLFAEFKEICDIYPSCGANQESWIARHNSGEMEIKAWVLGLRRDVPGVHLIEGFRKSTSKDEFLNRVLEILLRECPPTPDRKTS